MPIDLLEESGWREPIDLFDAVEKRKREIENPVSGQPPVGEIRQGKEPSLMDKVFRLFENPEKEQAKAVQALVDADLFKIAPSDAYRYRDAIDEGIKLNPQQVMASKRTTAMQRIEQALDIGGKQRELGLLGNQLLMTGDMKYFDEMQKIKMPDQEFIPESKLEGAFLAAAKMFPIMAHTGIESTKAALASGMIVGGAAAAAGPAAPLSVPAGFAAGATAGGLYAGYRESAKIEGGLALASIMNMKDKDGNPIDFEIARVMAFAIGQINGIIEVVQLKTIAKTIPGIRNLFSKAVLETLASKELKDKLLSLAGSYGGKVLSETKQEIYQETSSIVFEELGKKLTNMAKGTNFDQATIDQIVDRYKETAVEAAKGFSVMLAPGTVASAATTVVQDARVKAASKVTPKPAPGLEGIGRFESGNNYEAEHPKTKARGKYQIMPGNWPSWAQEAGLGEDAEMTPENQEVVAQFKWNQYMGRFDGNDQLAATAWFAGPGAAARLANGDMTILNRKDANGVTVADYIRRTTGREFGTEATAVSQGPAPVNIDEVIRRAAETDEDINTIIDDAFGSVESDNRVDMASRQSENMTSKETLGQEGTVILIPGENVSQGQLVLEPYAKGGIHQFSLGGNTVAEYDSVSGKIEVSPSFKGDQAGLINEIRKEFPEAGQKNSPEGMNSGEKLTGQTVITQPRREPVTSISPSDRPVKQVFSVEDVQHTSVAEAVNNGSISLEEAAVIDGIMAELPEAWREHFEPRISKQQMAPTEEQRKAAGVGKKEEAFVAGALIPEKMGELKTDAKHLAVLFDGHNITTFIHELGEFLHARALNHKDRETIKRLWKESKSKQARNEWFSDQFEQWWIQRKPMGKGLTKIFTKMLKAIKGLYDRIRGLKPIHPELANLFEDIITNGRDINEKYYYSDIEIVTKYILGAEPSEQLIKDQGFSGNSKTFMSWDPSSQCPKQEAFVNFILKQIQENNIPIEELANIDVISGFYDMAIAEGIDVPCSYRYVEMARRKAIAYHQAGAPITGVNFAMAKQIYKMVPYDGAILTWSQKRIDELNQRGGLRLFSFSDYIRAAHRVEVEKLLNDAKARELSIKAITKNPHFVEDFADRGITINISIDDLGFGYPKEQAIADAAKYDNVHIRAVGLNIEHIQQLSEEGVADVITPYHWDGKGTIPEGYTDMGHGTAGAKALDMLKALDPSLEQKLCCQAGGKCFDTTHIKQCATNCGMVAGNLSIPTKIITEKDALKEGQTSDKIDNATEQTSGETGIYGTAAENVTAKNEISAGYNQAEAQATAELKALLAKAEKALASAQKNNKQSAIEKAAEKVKSIKARIREITGQTRRTGEEKTVTEYSALKAAFTKAAQAAREAYRSGNKEGIEKAKQEMKAAVQAARDKRQAADKRQSDIDAIMKLSKMKGSIAVDYQKRIRDLMSDFDPKNVTAEKWAQLQSLQEYIDRNGVPLGINPKRLAELKRLTDIPLKSLTDEQLAMLRQQLELLTELGKLKAKMKYKYNERRRNTILNKILATTVNLDPSVAFDKGQLGHFDKLKVAALSFYLNTLHTPRVADMADGRMDYKGEQAKLVRSMGEGETAAVTNATKRQQGWLDWLKENNISLPEEDSESDIRMMIVIRVREGAMKAAQNLMDKHGIKEVPVLTPEEEAIVGYIRDDMERNKAKLAATWEEINGEIFPEQKVYYLPLKYEGEEEILPEAQTEGRGRTVNTFDGFSHKRRPNVDKIPRAGIARVYHEATMEQEWFTGIQPVIEDIKSVVLTPDYKAEAGQVLYDWWKTQLDIMARRGWMASAQMNAVSKALASFRHNIASATLAFKLPTVIMQPFAVFDAMAFVNGQLGPVAAAKVAGAVAESFLRPGWTKGIIANSAALQQRAAGELAIQEELARLDSSFLDKAKKVGFDLIQWTDLKTAAGVQEQVRKILIENGIDETQAKADAEFAMHMSQGSTSVAYRPHILAQGEAARTWFTFQNFVLNRWGILIHDVVMGKIVHGDDFKARFLGVISLGLLVAGGMAEDEARRKVRQLYSNPKEDKRNIFEQIVVNTLGLVPFFGNFITAASQKYTALPPTASHAQKMFEGAFTMAKGKDAKAKVKGGVKMSESLLTLLFGIPGTGQVYDLIEGVMSDGGNSRNSNTRRR